MNYGAIFSIKGPNKEKFLSPRIARERYSIPFAVSFGIKNAMNMRDNNDFIKLRRRVISDTNQDHFSY